MDPVSLATQVVSVAGILIAIVTLILQRRLEHETATQTLIHDQYALCRALDEMRVEHPDMSHMLALPAQNPKKPEQAWDTYELFRNKVRRHVESRGPINDGLRAEFYLREHAVALHVADIYEQTLLQHDLALKASDLRRAEILLGLLQYYEGRMLRNPRLRFHWDNGASDMMEKATRDRYDLEVRKAYPKDPTDAKSPLD